MSEQQQQQLQPNQPETRTEDGTLKDQSQSQQQEQKSTDQKADDKGGTTLLTQDDKKADDQGQKDDKSKDDGKKDDKSAKGAPEKYEDFKAPEGFEIDKATMEKATPMFKEMGLSQEQAQKLVDFYAGISKDAAEAPYKAWEELNKSWQDAVKNDPEIGGAKLDSDVKPTIAKALANLPEAQRAEFKAAMDLTGAGNHPAFVKAFYGLAKLVVEGGHVKGGGPSEHGQNDKGHAAKPTAAEAMWPTLKS